MRPFLSEGVVIESREMAKLTAKRAFLQLWNHLMISGEVEKARAIPMPWDLEEDLEVRKREKYAAFCLGQPLCAPEASAAAADEVFRRTKLDPEITWIVDRVLSLNAATLLDASAGYCDLAVEIAKLQCPSVVAVTNYPEEALAKAKGLGEGGKLPLQIVSGEFEDHGLQFSEDTMFDVVVLRGLLPFVKNATAVLTKAITLATKAVLITAPEGPAEEKAICDPWIQAGGARRAFSPFSLQLLTGERPTAIEHGGAAVHKKTLAVCLRPSPEEDAEGAGDTEELMLSKTE